jgi:hypothetical protein
MQYKNDFIPPLSIYLHLIPKEHRSFFLLYIKWFKLLGKRCVVDNKESLKVYEILYASVFRKNRPTTLIGKLQEEFISKNISLSLLTEPIEGFSLFVKNKYDLEITKLSPIILQIISPISRMVAVLNNNSPLFYQPFSGVVFAFLLLYIKNNTAVQNYFKNNKIKIDIKLLDELLLKSFNEAKYCVAVSKDVLFKLKISYFISLLKILIKKDNKKIKKIDYVNAFLYGLYYTLTIKGKKIKLKQM